MFFGGESCTSTNTNGSGEGTADEHNKPGISISIDQIESPQGGLISVLKGRQKSRKYHVATIFVDHFSKFTYVQFSESTASKKAVKANNAFENYAATFGVNIQKYYVKNGPSILEFSNKAYFLKIKSLHLVVLMHTTTMEFLSA